MARKGNPNWEYDELLLALDLYLNHGGHLGPGDPHVIELSEVLNALPIHEDRGTYGTFRNPSGVAMKLGNFQRFDPNHEGVGLKRGGAGDRVVWDRFADRPDELRVLAQSIREGASQGLLPTAPEVDEDEKVEGRLAFRMHRRAERDPGIVRRKKRAVKAATGRLACEACDLDFRERYGERGAGYIECHHLLPLSEGVERVTSLADLALVCSNCHTMIHRGPELLSIDELRKLLR